MFNPKDAVQSLLNDAYRSGSALAEAIFPYAPVPEDRAWREHIRDQHCEALVRSLGASQLSMPKPWLRVFSLPHSPALKISGGIWQCRRKTPKLSPRRVRK